VHDNDPFVSTLMLCIHELFDFSSRRPTSTIFCCDIAGNDSRRRFMSLINCGGDSSMRPDGVRNASGMRGSSAPMSTPCGFASNTSSDTPFGFVPNAEPYGPVCRMKSSVRAVPRRPSFDSSARISSTSRPDTGDDEFDTADDTIAVIIVSSSADTSHCEPSPCRMPPSFRMISHSSGCDGSFSSTGGL